jgi:hypothetical protein
LSTFIISSLRLFESGLSSLSMVFVFILKF